jgi:hypothetical protein
VLGKGIRESKGRSSGRMSTGRRRALAALCVEWPVSTRDTGKRRGSTEPHQSQEGSEDEERVALLGSGGWVCQDVNLPHTSSWGTIDSMGWRR